MDKSETIMQILDRYNTRYNPNRSGEQMISCPNQDGHAHGDKRPSCSLNLGKGVLYCQGCGLSGDAYNIIMTIERIDFKTATESIGNPNVVTESNFIL